MPFTAEAITLTDDERAELEWITQSRTLPAGDVFRAKLVLMLAGGLPYRTIQEKLDTTAPTIARWRLRFEGQRVAGLLEIRHPGQKPSVITPALQAKVLEMSRRKPKDGSTHWSCRKLASELNISKDTVQRIWHKAGLKPHRLERYMASDDPDFERKAADIIGLYLSPPQHAAVFCVDEKSAIQALDRLDPVLPMSPGAVSNGMGLNTTVTERFLFTLHWTYGREKCTARPRHDTPARNLLVFWISWSVVASRGRRSTSFWTTYRRTRPPRSRRFWKNIPMFIFTSRQPTPPGSIRLRSGSGESNGR